MKDTLVVAVQGDRIPSLPSRTTCNSPLLVCKRPLPLSVPHTSYFAHLPLVIRARQRIEKLTELCDALLQKGVNVYDSTRELLAIDVRQRKGESLMADEARAREDSAHHHTRNVACCVIAWRCALEQGQMQRSGPLRFGYVKCSRRRRARCSWMNVSAPSVSVCYGLWVGPAHCRVWRLVREWQMRRVAAARPLWSWLVPASAQLAHGKQTLAVRTSGGFLSAVVGVPHPRRALRHQRLGTMPVLRTKTEWTARAQGGWTHVSDQTAKHFRKRRGARAHYSRRAEAEIASSATGSRTQRRSACSSE